MVADQVVDQLGTTVDPKLDRIFVDGTPLRPRRLVYLAVNKPVGVVTTNADPEGRPRVIDFVPPDERVFPVGRLDRSSEGLILLTNDGDLAQKLAHPRYEIRKVYRVTVAGKVDVETMRQMERGIHIAEGLVRVEGARVLKTRGRSTELEITLKEGKNREIRRILARLGHKVQQLRRIAIGPLRLGEMPTGAYRRLTSDELKRLKQAVETAEVGGESTTRRAKNTSGKRPAKVRPDRITKSTTKRPVDSREGRTAKSNTKRAGGAGKGRPIKSATKPVASSREGRPVNPSIKKVGKGLATLGEGRKVGSVIGAEPGPPSTARADAKARRTKDKVVIQARTRKSAGRQSKRADE